MRSQDLSMLETGYSQAPLRLMAKSGQWGFYEPPTRVCVWGGGTCVCGGGGGTYRLDPSPHRVSLSKTESRSHIL